MALTEELTFKLGDDGVVLNTDSSSIPFVDTYTVRGLDSAPFRETEQDWEGNDGSFLDAEFEKGRPVILEATVIADVDEMEEYLDNLKENYAPSATLVPFYFKAPGRAERVLFVKPQGARYNWDSLRRTGQAEIQLMMFAEDPRIYDATLLDEVITQGATVFTGLGFNLGFSFGFGGTSSLTDAVDVIVGGNRPTPAVFEIAGAVTNPRIVNDTLGVIMQFNITLGASDTLVIDTKHRTVRLNGTTNARTALVAPTWFMLQKGTNTLRYQAETAGTSTLTISYRNAWR
jgi:phage-related protein